jgi:hypothetical protein
MESGGHGFLFTLVIIETRSFRTSREKPAEAEHANLVKIMQEWHDSKTLFSVFL